MITIFAVDKSGKISYTCKLSDEEEKNSKLTAKHVLDSIKNSSTVITIKTGINLADLGKDMVLSHQVDLINILQKKEPTNKEIKTR